MLLETSIVACGRYSYHAEGDGPESEPEENADAEQKPAPLDVVGVNSPRSNGAQKVADGHEHPAGVRVLQVHRNSNPAGAASAAHGHVIVTRREGGRVGA